MVDLNKYYLILKSIHIVGIISWMAGILYFYRLLIYHYNYGQDDNKIHSMFKIMEKRLMNYITIPAMIVSIISGISIIFINPLLFQLHWFHVKLLTAGLMILATLYGMRPMNAFKKRDFSKYSDRTLRILNEVPTFFMIIIVIMVIIRPF